MDSIKLDLAIVAASKLKDCKPSKTPFLSGVKLEEAGSSPMVNNTLYSKDSVRGEIYTMGYF